MKTAYCYIGPSISMPYFLYYWYILPMLSVLDYLLLCCVDFENKIYIYLSIKTIMNGDMEKHIPQKTLSGQWDIPWLTRDIKKQIRLK